MKYCQKILHWGEMRKGEVPVVQPSAPEKRTLQTPSLHRLCLSEVCSCFYPLGKKVNLLLFSNLGKQLHMNSICPQNCSSGSSKDDLNHSIAHFLINLLTCCPVTLLDHTQQLQHIYPKCPTCWHDVHGSNRCHHIGMPCLSGQVKSLINQGSYRMDKQVGQVLD